MLGSYYNKRHAPVGSNAVQGYIESRLIDLHNVAASSIKNYRLKIFGFFLGALFIIMLPYLHIGVFYLKIWTPNKAEINRNGCMCNCFDTIFRGAYENPGYSTYKHVYFNATRETFSIWVFTIIFVLLSYESVKYLLRVVTSSRARSSMVFLFAVNIYPNYYSWWSYFSYYNEEFFVYYAHHMLFTVTELLSTCVVLNLCDSLNPTRPWKLWVIVAVNLMHIFSAGADQFVEHVVRGRGKNFQNARDIGLMVPDVLLIAVSLYELLMYSRRDRVGVRSLCSLDYVVLMVVIVGGGTFLTQFL